MSPAAVLLALLALPPSRLDVGEAPAARRARLEPVAEAIAAAARSRSEVAILLALGKHESAFALLVQMGRCEEMPAGERCDHGLARGPWQLHELACRVAWTLPAGSAESLREEAACAIRLLRWNAERGRHHALTPVHAAFAGYAARGWQWPGADRRVATAREIEGRLR